MCNIWRNPQQETIPKFLYESIVAELGELGCYYLSFSGGESLLVKDIMERITFAKEFIPYVHLVSNGWVIDRAVAEELHATNLDEISISLDGIGKTHDELRGVDGSFEKAVEAIDNLKRYAPDIKIVINSIITPGNIKDLYEVVKLVEGLGLQQKFQPINDHPVFEGQETKSSEYHFNQTELDEVEAFVDFAKNKKYIVNSDYFLSQIPKFFSGKVANGLSHDRCTLGYFFCEFRQDGELYPCVTGMGWKKGFMPVDGLRKTLYSDAYRKTLKKLEACKSCRSNMYVCYFEPRINFPIGNFIKYTLFS